MFSKNQIVNGLIKYVELEVISKVEDKALQIVLGIGITALRRPRPRSIRRAVRLPWWSQGRSHRR